MSLHAPVPDPYPGRACDRCRRKKAKCDSIDHSCTGCRGANQACTFIIPPGKRGPKGRPRRPNANVRKNGSEQHHNLLSISPSSASQSFHSPTVQSGTILSESPATQPLYLSGDPTTIERYRRLENDVASIASFSTSLDVAARECADLFFNFIVPFNLSVHETRFRHLLHEALECSPPGASLTPATFTLITAVCAKVCYFIPSDMFPLGEVIAETFFEASRSCFLSYADTDLENPCADSITIRFLHSNCLHTRAQSTISWHVYGETIRLVQRMRLHNEETYASLSPLEAEMCRHAFWHVFVGDKSLAVLRGMPITIHEYSFDEGITTAYSSSEQNEYTLGANIGIQIWRHAADLLLRMRVIKANYTTGHDLPRPLLTQPDHASLNQLYVRFATCIDDLPVHLFPDNIALSSSHASSTSNKFATQITDIHVTYLTLKMHLVEKLEDTGYFSGESKDMLVLRKTEIAREMVRLLQNLPLWALKMNGEPCAEKIRLVGVSLIAIIQDGSPFEVRARRDFAVLLDILSQLDSKASDSLHHELL